MMFERRRFTCTATDSLRRWLAALELMPPIWPFLDLRIAIRNELWKREREEDLLVAWVLGLNAEIEG